MISTPINYLLRLKSGFPLTTFQSKQAPLFLHRPSPSSARMASDDQASAPTYKGPPVAVIGAGVAGCIAASSLAERGVPAKLFEMGRGPGGRLSTRRETARDGTELLFDHGGQYITVNYPSVQPLVDKWQAAGLLDIWHTKFGSYDFVSRVYSEETTHDGGKPKYVGVPGMNSICKAMAMQPGITSEYNTKVVKLIWKDEGLWDLKSQKGESLGLYGAVVVADKALASERFRDQTGLPPPLEDAGVPDLYKKMYGLGSVPCFAVMVAFHQPLGSVRYDRFTIKSSDLLAVAVRVSSKPGRKVLPKSEIWDLSTLLKRGPEFDQNQDMIQQLSEYWVLQSTEEFARKIIAKEGLSKPSSASLDSIAQTLLKQFQEIVPEATNPFHVKAHRWGSSFPTDFAAPEEKCLVDAIRKIAACGDFCVSPSIDGAIVSGLAAADAIYRILNIPAAKF